MSADSLRVLLIEDNAGDARLISEMLRGSMPVRIDLDRELDLTAGMEKLNRTVYDVVLLDLGLPESRGTETYHVLRQRHPTIPVVVLTGQDEEAVLAGELLRAGAQDYLVKGQVDSKLLARSLRHAVERGRIEQQLRQRAAELTEAARRKDEFLALLAHELRNPLAPMAMALELLRRGTTGEKRQWSLDMMNRQLRHLSRLIGDLLDVSRLTTGKISLQLETVDLGVLAKRASDAVLPAIEERRHQLTLDLPPEGTVQLMADPVRLEQVMVNLLTNAAKFTPPGGRIDLRVESSGDQAHIHVRDTGIGIPSSMLDKVFEIFSQIDASTSRESQWGLGIGLALVRGLVELHGGRVRAHSAGPGTGSEFIVDLPINLPTAAADDPPADSDCAGQQSRRILIVDDQAEFATSMKHWLQSCGHTVQVANNGYFAIAAARLMKPDLVLLDIGMAGMDGHEVARRLRQLPELAQTMIVAITGYGRSEDRQRSLEAGIDRHYVKPISPAILQELLQQQMVHGVAGGVRLAGAYERQTDRL